MEELLEERLQLAEERISGMEMEKEEFPPDFCGYFEAAARWFRLLFAAKKLLQSGELLRLERKIL